MEEVKIKKKNALDVSVKVLKIISLILFCVITIFLFFLVIRSFVHDLEAINLNYDERVEGLGMSIILINLLVAPGAYGMLFIINLIGLILGVIKELKEKNETWKIFMIFMIMDVWAYILLFTTGMILVSNL